MDNAIKYCSENSIIYLNSYTVNDYYHIDIINSVDSPIKDETYSHIFEPFIKSKTSKEETSTGLGLYLCNEIIRDHNGTISLQNGTTIKLLIILPIKVEKINN